MSSYYGDSVFYGNDCTGRIEQLTTIREHRAPTDDSIRFYEEIKQKAYNSIVMTFKPENNILGIASAVFKDYMSGDSFCRYRLKLNGIVIEDEIRIKDVYVLSEKDVMEKIYESASKHIAIELIKTLAANKNGY